MDDATQIMEPNNIFEQQIHKYMKAEGQALLKGIACVLLDIPPT